MIVRWGLEELPGVLEDVGSERPLLVAGQRWDALAIPAAARWSEIPSDRISVPPTVDGILAVGGGSAIDTAKAGKTPKLALTPEEVNALPKSKAPTAAAPATPAAVGPQRTYPPLEPRT